MIKAILFDCFGVLYPDTYWTMANEYLGEDYSGHEQELHDLVKQVDLGHMTRDELWGGFADLVGHTKEEVYQRLENFTGLDTRLLEFIEEHKSTHKIGMISNVGQGFLERMFKEKPADYYFDVIVLSSEVALVKPDVRIYELAAERLGVDTNDCVFIDDLEKNVEGARNAGMHAIQYSNFSDFKRLLRPLIADSDN
ncbi:HAD family phosphatase [Candidatus Saccharibacteria bacterium]|nr:HAD family phosphatase [Candidatus Saccharibacteria bacterium]